MEEVHKELDEHRAEIQKLKAECFMKADLWESLKKSHEQQSLRFQEAKLQIQKHSQELSAKAGEISEARKMIQDLKSQLHENELANRNLTFANVKLRDEYGGKLQELEVEVRKLVSALDKAAGKNEELEQKLSASSQQILGLKNLLKISEKKCLEAEQTAQAPKELRQRDDMILNLEDDNRNQRDQLKWKAEKFNHLEDAHKRLQERHRMTKDQLEREKSALFEEIISLERRLDSQTRVAESLQNQLDICNHALAREEGRRKVLESQVYEYKSRFENASVLCREERLKIESSTAHSVQEVARLRNSLGKKEIASKEMAMKLAHLEQENQEMRESLKELQEAQIRSAIAASSVTDLRNELRGLEEVYSNCSKNLMAKETELNSQIKKMRKEMDTYNSELKSKEKQIQESQKELETLNSTIFVLNEEISITSSVLKLAFLEVYSRLTNVVTELEARNNEKEDEISYLTKQLDISNTALNKTHLDFKHEHEQVLSELKNKENQIQELQKELETLNTTTCVLNEEIFITSSVLKLGFFEAYSGILNVAAELEVHNKEKEDEISSLTKQLAISNNALNKTHLDFKLEHEEVLSLQKRANSLDLMEQQQIVLIEELERYKNMLKEASESQLHLKQQIMQMEIAVNDDRRSILQVLEEAESELAEKVNEGKQLQFELQNWTSTAETRKICLGGNRCEQMETSCLAQCKTEETLSHNKGRPLSVYEEQEKSTDHCTGSLEKDKTSLKQDSIVRKVEFTSSASINSEKLSEQKAEKLAQIPNTKDKRRKDFQEPAMRPEEDVTNTTIQSSSQELKRHVENIVIGESFKNVEYLKNIELEEKSMIIVELKSKEKQIQELQKELETLHSTVYVLNEEISIIVLVLKSGLLEAYSGVSNVADELEVCNQEKSDQISTLAKTLAKSNTALNKAHLDLKHEHDEVLSLQKKVDSLDLMEQQQILMVEELKRYKDTLSESSDSQLHLKQQIMQMENAINEDRRCVLQVLEEVESELAEKVDEGNQLQFELQNWKSTGEDLNICLGGNQYEQMEKSCLAPCETEGTLSHNKDGFFTIPNEKDQRTIEHEEQEQTSTHRTTQSVLEALQKQVEIIVISEALKYSEHLKNIELKEKNKIIVDSLRDNLTYHEESLFHLKQETKQLQAMLKANETETEKLKKQFSNDRCSMKEQLKMLELEKEVLVNDFKKISGERKGDILAHMEEICDQLGEFSYEDTKLMNILEKILQTSEVELSNGLDDSTRSYATSSYLSVIKKLEVETEERSPLKEFNH